MTIEISLSVPIDLLAKSYEAVKMRSCTDFTFICRGRKTINVPILVVYSLMSNIRYIFMQDCLTSEYHLKSNVEFDIVNDFFNEIQKTTFKIEKANVESFLMLAQELGISQIIQGVEEMFTDTLTTKFNPEKISYKSDKKYEIIAKNVKNLQEQDIDLIKSMPIEFQHNIFKKGLSFESADEFALFLIKNQMDTSLFQYINLKEITHNILQDIIRYVGNEDIPFVQKYMQYLQDKKKEYKCLLIYPSSNAIIPTYFFEEYNDSKDNNLCNIHIHLIDEESTRAMVENNRKFFNKYDLLMIGGCDASNYIFLEKGFSYDQGNVINECFAEFYRNGGKIVYFHDSLYCNPENSVFNISELGKVIDIRNYSVRNEIKFIDAVDDKMKDFSNSIQQKPFNIPNNFVVDDTHQTCTYSNLKQIITFVGLESQYFLQVSENKRISVIEIGHSIKINENSRKLLYNLIYNMIIA